MVLDFLFLSLSPSLSQYLSLFLSVPYKEDFTGLFLLSLSPSPPSISISRYMSLSLYLLSLSLSQPFR